MESNPRYIHFAESHTLIDPVIIVPIIVEVLNPQSIVDIGCGIGTFLKVFRDNGVKEIVGLDGSWVDRNLFSDNIDLSNFRVVDLEKGFSLERRFDLAVCLEVFEHLHESSADLAVQNLTDLSDIILFSASIPGQIGQNHVNEQWPQYWVEKFKKYNYTFYDVLRPIFWNNKKLARWYKQNMFIVVKDGKEGKIKSFEKYFDNEIKALVHPEYFNLRAKEREELIDKYEILLNQYNLIFRGKANFILYIKLIAKFFIQKVSSFR